MDMSRSFSDLKVPYVYYKFHQPKSNFHMSWNSKGPKPSKCHPPPRNSRVPENWGILKAHHDPFILKFYRLPHFLGRRALGGVPFDLLWTFSMNISNKWPSPWCIMLAFQVDLGQSSMESWQMKQTPPKISEDTWLGSSPMAISHEWP